MSYIELTNECNQNCLFCNRPREKLFRLSTIEAKKIIDILKKKTTCLIFTGGEPTIRDDLPELIKYAKEVGIERVEIQTNGVRLADKKYLKKLRDVKTDMVNLALHSHIPEISDRLTNTPGSFKKTIKGIKNVIKIHLPIEVAVVITKENYRYLLEYVKFVKANFGNSICSISFKFVRPDESAWKNKWVIPKYSEAEPYIYRAFEYCKSNKINFNTELFPLCYMQGYEEHSIEFMRIIKNISFNTVWQGNIFRKESQKFIDNFQTKAPQCKICWLKEACPGIRKNYVKIHGNDELFPVFNDRDEITKKVI